MISEDAMYLRMISGCCVSRIRTRDSNRCRFSWSVSIVSVSSAIEPWLYPSEEGNKDYMLLETYYFLFFCQGPPSRELI